MQQENHRMIGIICYRLPYELSNQLYQEFDYRWKDVLYMVEHFEYYSRLKKDLKALEMMLALSIYHKRVITNLDAAVKFRNTVAMKSKADTVSIGSYDFGPEQKNRVLAIVMDFRRIQERFGLNEVMEYTETKDFLRNVLNFKTNLGNRKKDRN